MNHQGCQILLFEDASGFAEKICKAVQAELPTGFRIEQFVPKAKKTDRTYEDRIKEELSDPKFSDLVLLVSDRDLSGIDVYGGLSEVVISRVAADKGLPICLYAQGLPGDELDRLMNWSEGQVVLDSSNVKHMAREIVTIATGFADIAEKTNKILKKRTKRPKTPSEFLASILGRETLSDRIAMYASGDRSSAMPLLQSLDDSSRLIKNLPTFLGNWLHESILRFPGIIVDSISAASYLNIDQRLFATNTEVSSVFSEAIYDGPFSSKDNPRWWRDRLDLIVFKAGLKDGRALAENVTGKKIKACKCSVDKNIQAGYFCMATREPVSFENSVGNITWFPPGADLARINKVTFDKIGPWLGLY